jgi:hypothetical protein
MRVGFALVLCCAVLACGKGGGKAAAPSGRDAVVAAWQKAGLTVSAMTADKSGAVGDDCTTGTVSGVDVVLCSFASPADAKAAEARGYAWVGLATGTAVVQANLVVAVADRRTADPTGRTINTIANTFRGK